MADGKPLGTAGSAIWFAVPALLLLAATRLLLPWLIQKGIHGLYAWYICGSIVMGGMFVTAISLAGKPILESLRLKRPTKGQLKTTAFVSLISLAGMALTWLAAESILGRSESMMPPFIQGTVLEGQNRVLLFLAWLPMFFFNIAGEELLWRGYLLPRQELAFGKNAWIINGLLWIVFHIPFGLRIIIMVLPVFFTLPWLAMKTKSTWPGIILHGLVNGPAFAMILLGII